VALWHERDISHSSVERIVLPDSCILLDYMLAELTTLVARLKVYPQNMRRNMARSKGLHHSQKVLLSLTERGMPRKDAYELVQKCAMAAWQDGTEATFRDHLLREPKIRKLFTGGELYQLFDDTSHFRHLREAFRRVGL